MAKMKLTTPELGDSEMEFSEVIGLLWRRRWLVVLISVAFAGGGLAYSIFATPMFRAQTTLMRKESGPSSGPLAQLGGLASLAGIGIGADNGLAPVAVLKSQGLARDFIEKNDLVPVLFAEKWDKKAGTWKGGDRNKHPDIQDAVSLFDRKIRSVTDDKKSGLVTVSITWSDANLAKTWANELVAMVNARMREETLTEAEHNVNFLRSELASSNIPSLQQSMGRVLESEMQKLMLARGSAEFSFRVVDRAEAPKKPASPRKLVILVGSFILGLVTSFVIVVLLNALRGPTNVPAG